MTQLISAHQPARGSCHPRPSRRPKRSPRFITQGSKTSQGPRDRRAAEQALLLLGAGCTLLPGPLHPSASPAPTSAHTRGPITPAPHQPVGGCLLLLVFSQEHLAKWTSETHPHPTSRPRRSPSPPQHLYLQPSRRRSGRPHTHRLRGPCSQRTSTLASPCRRCKPEPGPAGAAGAGAWGGLGRGSRCRLPGLRTARCGQGPATEALPGGEPGTHMPLARHRQQGRPGPLRGSDEDAAISCPTAAPRGLGADPVWGNTLPSQPLHQLLSGPIHQPQERGPPRSPARPAPRLLEHLCSGREARAAAWPKSARPALAATRSTHPSSSASASASSARAPLCSTGQWA